MTTHFIPYDAPVSGRGDYRRTQALCEEVVHPRVHAAAPTCEECRRLLAEGQTALGQLREEDV